MDRHKLEREQAWIGDAVLTLYMREMILREQGAIDGLRCESLTSNQFLAAFGEPTAVEAAIGREYQSGGLAQAYSWIEQSLLPVVRKQDEKRLRRSGVTRGHVPPR